MSIERVDSSVTLPVYVCIGTRSVGQRCTCSLYRQNSTYGRASKYGRQQRHHAQQ